MPIYVSKLWKEVLDFLIFIHVLGLVGLAEDLSELLFLILQYLILHRLRLFDLF